MQNVFLIFINNFYDNFNNPTYTGAFSNDGTNYVNVNSQFKTMYYGPINNSSTILGTINSVAGTIFN